MVYINYKQKADETHAAICWEMYMEGQLMELCTGGGNSIIPS